MTKIHGNDRRKPILRVRKHFPYMGIEVLFTAMSMSLSGVCLSPEKGGMMLTSDPVSARNVCVYLIHKRGDWWNGWCHTSPLVAGLGVSPATRVLALLRRLTKLGMRGGLVELFESGVLNGAGLTVATRSLRAAAVRMEETRSVKCHGGMHCDQ